MDTFAKLRALLDAVEAWLDLIERGPMKPASRELARSLRAYLGHCRRDRRKWRAAAAAERAMPNVL